MNRLTAFPIKQIGLISTFFFICSLALFSEEPEKVKVNVLVILGSKSDKEICPKLKLLAAEIQKKDSSLTGFKLSKTICESIEMGKCKELELVDNKVMKICVNKQLNEDGKMILTIHPPTLGQITYSCKCEKYFPIITTYKTKSDQQQILILAIMAKKCN